MRIPARLWAFSGLDGAGKSTQIELLQRGLAVRKISARRVWARGGYTPLFDWGKAMVRRASPRAIPRAGHSAERTQRFRSPLVRTVWLTIAMLDLLAYYGVWVRWLQWSGRTVLADRWLEDTELDFDLTFPETKPTRWWLWRAVKCLVPRPAAHFLFLIPVDVSLQRSREKQEPFPDSEETLRRRLAAYEAILGREGRISLDGRLPREELHARVMRACGIAE